MHAFPLSVSGVDASLSVVAAVGSLIVLVVLTVLCAKKNKKPDLTCEWCQATGFASDEDLQMHYAKVHSRGNSISAPQNKRQSILMLPDQIDEETIDGSQQGAKYTLAPVAPLAIKPPESGYIEPQSSVDSRDAVLPSTPTSKSAPLPPPLMSLSGGIESEIDECVYETAIPDMRGQMPVYKFDDGSDGLYDTAVSDTSSIMVYDTVTLDMGDNYVENTISKREAILSKLKVADPSELVLGSKLGEGVAGLVFRGKFRGETVAVKQLTKETEESSEEFEDEAVIMGSLTHERVTKILGVIFDRNPKQIIVEFMAFGDLATFLMKHREIRNTASSIGISKIMQLAKDVAEGMEFLERLGCVHRDLAARNVLLDGALRGKVTDFGLSRELYKKVYYQQIQSRVLPVRWMAFETLTLGKSSSKSDVWSYGICLWEMFTLCDVPYADFAGGREIVEFLDAGGRLSQPRECPQPMYDLMLQCWNSDPKLRIAFQEIRERLDPISDDVIAKAKRRAEIKLRKAWWHVGKVSRHDAEQLLIKWGATAGIFLIRANEEGWVLGRCSPSGETTKISHSKIQSENGNFRLITKNTAMQSLVFNTLEELVAHHQTVAFPDGTRLTSVAPPVAVQEHNKTHKYINIDDGDQDKITDKRYKNMSREDEIFRASAGIGGSPHMTAQPNRKYVNIEGDDDQSRL